MRDYLRRLVRRAHHGSDDELLGRVLSAVDEAVRRKLLVLDDGQRELLEAVSKDRVWFDPMSETAFCATDSGEPLDVTEALRVLREPPPLVIHDAVNYTLPRELRPLVAVRVTHLGERFL